MTNRISRLKTALFANTREISLERALLYTASHRQTEGEPVILRRAKAPWRAISSRRRNTTRRSPPSRAVDW